MKRRMAGRLGMCAVLALGLASVPAGAATRTWSGTGTNDWFAGGAVFDSAGFYVTVAQALLDGGGGGGLTKVGGGMLTLAGTNTYSGATTVSAGAVLVQNDAALGTTDGGTTVANGARLILDGGVTLTGEAVTIFGDGGSASSYDGALKANSAAGAAWNGTVVLGDGAAGVGTGTGSTLTLGGDIRDGGGTHLRVSGGAGSGVVVLTGPAKTYSGDTRIARGTLRLAAANLLPAGTTLDVDCASMSENAVFNLAGFAQTVSGLRRSGSGAGTGGGTVTSSAAGGALTVHAVADCTFDGTITGTLTLTKAGAGTLTLGGACTFSGATTIADGTLKLDLGNNRLPTGQLVTLGNAGDVGAAALDLNGRSQQVAGLGTLGTTMRMSVTNSAATTATLTVSTAADQTYAGTLDGNLALTKAGATTLALTAPNTFSGATTVSAGIVRMRHPLALGPAGGGGIAVASGARVELSDSIVVTGKTVTIAGTGGNNMGALQGYTGTNTWAGRVILGADGARVGANGAGRELRVTGPIDDGANTYGLAVRNADGGGVVVLSGTNTYGGATTIVVGLCKLGGGNRLPVGTILTIGNGSNAATATFDLNGHNQVVGGLAHLGTTMTRTLTDSTAAGVTLTVNSAAAAAAYGGRLAGKFTLAKTGAFDQKLSGDNSGFTGAARVLAGRLLLAADASGSAGAVWDVADGAELVYDNSATGGVHTVQLGALTGGAGATLRNGGTLAGVTTFAIGGKGTNTTFSGAIRDFDGDTRTALSKAGGATLTLGGTNTYTGVTTVNSGTLMATQLGTAGEAASSLGAPSGADRTIVFGATGGNGVLAYAGDTTVSDRPISLHANAGGGCGLQVLGSGKLTLRGGVTGPHSFTLGGAGVGELAGVVHITAGNLNKVDAGTWVLSAANTYTVPTQLNAGTLALGADHALGVNTLSLNGGTLTSDGPAARVANNPITLTASSTLGQTAGGTGPLTLGGGFYVGTVPKTLTVHNTTTLAGVVTGTASASLTKAGPGTLILTNANTYQGATIVTAGTLLVNGSHAGGGGYTATGGAVLGGAGTVDSAVSLDGTATLAPGGTNAPAVFTVSGPVTLRSGTVFHVNIGGATAGAEYDQLVATGAVNLDGATLRVTLAPGYRPPQGTVFTIVRDCASLSGTFANLQNGAAIVVEAEPFVINYRPEARSVIGIGGRLAAPPLPHHRAYGSRTRRFR